MLAPEVPWPRVPNATGGQSVGRIRRRLVAVLSLAFSLQAVAGVAEVPDDVNARIARAKSQIATQSGARARGVARDRDGAAAISGEGGAVSGAGIFNDGCTIAIGNVLEDDQRIGTSARKETTVIITGDVIQAGNNCR